MRIKTPKDIEQESFRIIESEAGPHDQFSDEEWEVVRRIIHATADFSFMETIQFHPVAILSGVRALRSGKPIYVDTEMLAAGISKKARENWGCQIVCLVSDSEVMHRSLESGLTRSAVALRCAARRLRDGIVAIGNAPTALHEAITLFEKGVLKPALIIGMPVGFVQARESKERLSHCPVPYITNIDRKGGTTATAATLNALIRIAERKGEERHERG